MEGGGTYGADLGLEANVFAYRLLSCADTLGLWLRSLERLTPL